MQPTLPQPGQGWDTLLMTPRYNGGDELPDELRPLLDASVGQVPSVGLTVDGTPSVLFVVQPIQGPNGQPQRMVHWCSDGRTPLRTSLDMLDALTSREPDVVFLAFVRRPALVRLLAARGWWIQGHEDNPFMALMVCQGGAAQAAQ